MERYPSDLTDFEWAILEPLIPPAKPGGRPREVDMRAVLNAIFYILRTGCAWRYLPREYPPRSTVYGYFAQFREEGVWIHIMTILRERWRMDAGREATPSAAIIDSQSVKTTERGGPHGYDFGKKVKGRKRHILVDTNGLILHVLVHEANILDCHGGKLLLAELPEGFPRLSLIWTDSAYAKGGFEEWVKETLGWRTEVVKHPWTGLRAVWAKPGQVIDWEKIRPRGFHVLKRRWVVERTFAWIGRYRRMSKDYEFKMSSSESMVCLTMIRLLVKRLARTAEAAREKGRLLHTA